MEIQHNASTHFAPSHRSDAAEIANLAETKMIDSRLLQLDRMDPVRGTGPAEEKLIRNVTEMQSDEVEDMLRVMESFSNNSSIGDFDEDEWIDINRDLGVGANIERLLALLLTVLRLVARVNTEQTKNAAQMGILSTKLAEQSGTFSINSAMSNLSGASAALFASGVMVGLGGMTSLKGINSNIQNVKKNAADIDKLRAHPVQIDNEVGSVVTPARSQELPHSKKSESAVLQYKGHDAESLVHGSTTEQQISRLKADQMQLTGHAMMGMSYSIGGLGIAAFGVRSASEKADATISDAQKEVASGLQRNEDQAAQQKADIVAKILALVAAAQDLNIQTVSTLSQAIRV